MRNFESFQEFNKEPRIPIISRLIPQSARTLAQEIAEHTYGNMQGLFEHFFIRVSAIDGVESIGVLIETWSNAPRSIALQCYIDFATLGMSEVESPGAAFSDAVDEEIEEKKGHDDFLLDVTFANAGGNIEKALETFPYKKRFWIPEEREPSQRILIARIAVPEKNSFLLR